MLRTMPAHAMHAQHIRPLRHLVAAAARPLGACSRAVHAAASVVVSSSSSRQHLSQPATRVPSSRQRSGSSTRCHAVVPPLAMVNVDFASPSLVLGVTLIGCGIALLQVRNMQREVSRDADIVVAAMISIVGSTLIFQGWRLDPLLLLCQALTTSVAFWYGLEAFKLRAEVVQEEDADMPPGQQLPPLQDLPYNRQQQQQDLNPAQPGYLPPGTDRPLAPWAQQQQQAGAYGPSSSNARWGLPPAGQQAMPYDVFAGGSTMGQAPEATYAGYDQELLGSSGQQQQQGYVPGMGAYSSSSGYGPAAAGAYGQQQPGQLPAGQQDLQQQQFDWQTGGYLQQQQMPQQYMQQQPGWYPDPSGVPAGALQPQQQQLPGLLDPYNTGAAAPGGMGALPDGSDMAGGYGLDGIGQPLQQPADQQQQQQRPPGGGRSGYERVDDWE